MYAIDTEVHALLRFYIKAVVAVQYTEHRTSGPEIISTKRENQEKRDEKGKAGVARIQRQREKEPERREEMPG